MRERTKKRLDTIAFAGVSLALIGYPSGSLPHSLGDIVSC
jgi:hypothetical protein